MVFRVSCRPRGLTSRRPWPAGAAVKRALGADCRCDHDDIGVNGNILAGDPAGGSITLTGGTLTGSPGNRRRDHDWRRRRGQRCAGNPRAGHGPWYASRPLSASRSARSTDTLAHGGSV